MNFLDALRLARLRAELKRHERWPREKVLDYQTAALRRLRDYVYLKSDFYREHHAGLYDRPLDELPTVNKAMVMEHFDRLVTDPRIRRADVERHLNNPSGAFLDGYSISLSSGTSGHRGICLYSGEEWLTFLASLERTNSWAGFHKPLVGKMKIAVVTSTSNVHVSAKSTSSLRRRRMPCLALDANEPVPTITQKLNAWQPEMLTTYASLLRSLADEQLAGRLRISPSIIFTGAEVLPPETRERAVRAWGPCVFDQYGTSEAGKMAAECRNHSGLHINEDLVILEVVDRRGQPVKAGEYGEKVLLTVLYQRTQPLIRYEITDLARVQKGDCGCGLPFSRLESIQGRVGEVLTMPSAAGGSMEVPPILFTLYLDDLPISAWQIVQRPEGLELLMAGAPPELRDEEVVEGMQGTLERFGIAYVPLAVRRVAEIPRAASGKYVRVRCDAAPSR